MISYTTQQGSNVWDIRGKASDEKPTEGVPNGSTYWEIDGQHRLFMFDAETKTWYEQ